MHLFKKKWIIIFGTVTLLGIAGLQACGNNTAPALAVINVKGAAR